MGRPLVVARGDLLPSPVRAARSSGRTRGDGEGGREATGDQGLGIGHVVGTGEGALVGAGVASTIVLSASGGAADEPQALRPRRSRGSRSAPRTSGLSAKKPLVTSRRGG